ncbi:MAG TPA: ATP-binding protein, partial [Nocardioides sp.]
MDVDALRATLETGEDFRTEFKEHVNDDRLTEAIVCLANGDGGHLIIGVGDDGAVIGARPRHGSHTDPARVAALVANRTAPALAVIVEVIEIDGHTVIVIEVPRPSTLVATTTGLYIRRAIDVSGHPQCLPMQPHEAMARMGTLGEQDLSTLPVAGLSMDDLDPNELRRFRDLARSQGDGALGELSDHDILAALGFIAPTAELTVGAVLLFGTQGALARHAPTHETAFQVLDDLAVKVNRIERQPLIRSMIEMAEALRSYNPEEEIEAGLFRVGLPLYSDVAIRELLANALVHRDYSLNGQTRVQVEDRALSVTNPGGFPQGITIGNLLTAPPQARNPRLADAFKRAGLVERTGRGVNRVYRSQLALGRPEPDYSRSTREWVEVRLPAGPADRELAAFVAQAERSGRPVSLGTLQVLHEVRQERRITSSRAAELLQIPTDEARVALNGLVEQGYLESRGERKGRTYHLSAAVYREMGDASEYVRTRGFDDIQQRQMVITYVSEHGSISRSEAAELCQLSPAQASRLLARMAGDGDLTMTGSRRTARYVLPS